MKNKTLFLPGFHLQTLRRKPRSAARKRADEHARIRRYSLSELGACFTRFIPNHLFAQNASGVFSRQRVFNKRNSFWALFSQVLDADAGCREVIRKIQAYAAAKGLAVPSSSTSAYCQARAKLSVDFLGSILKQTGAQLQASGARHRWKQRRVVLLDGTGISMPDTPANQALWPQHGRQQPGCGFPQATGVCLLLSGQRRSDKPSRGGSKDQ